MARIIDASGLTGYPIPGAKIVTSVVSSAYLKIEIKTATGNDPSPTEPLLAAFPTTPGAGAVYSGRYITTPLSVTIYDNALGMVDPYNNNLPFRFWVVLIDDDGVWRLGVVICSLICLNGNAFVGLDEWKPISSTLESLGTPRTKAVGVFYTNTAAVSGKSFRIVGFLTFNSGLATVGVYNVNPDVIQMFGPGIPKPGQIVATGSSFFGVNSGIGSAIPFDNTIPQISEGDLMFLISPFVAQSPANWIEHDYFLQVCALGSAGTIARVIGSIFQDSNADALAAGATDVRVGSNGQLRIAARTLARSQNASFSARAGIDSTFNAGSTFGVGEGDSGSLRFNGTMTSIYSIKEYMG